MITKIFNPTEETEENQLPQLKKFSSLSLQIGLITLSKLSKKLYDICFSAEEVAHKMFDGYSSDKTPPNKKLGTYLEDIHRANKIFVMYSGT